MLELKFKYIAVERRVFVAETNQILPGAILEKSCEQRKEQENKHFNLTKEHLDRVRHIDGFPIAKDEDIINLSDPPCYTACPNPFIEDFIKEHGKPYDPDNDNYHRQPFAADVSEGKNDPIYNAHSYHTKVPHKAIMRYILHYTEPGDIVFDGFCGTGMTGVAAQLCADRNVVESLGYNVQDDGTILDEGMGPLRLCTPHIPGDCENRPPLLGSKVAGYEGPTAFPGLYNDACKR